MKKNDDLRDMACSVFSCAEMQQCSCCVENARLRREIATLSERLSLSKRLLGLLETGDPDALGEVSSLLDGGDNDGLGHMKDLPARDLGEGVDKVAAHA